LLSIVDQVVAEKIPEGQAGISGAVVQQSGLIEPPRSFDRRYLVVASELESGGGGHHRRSPGVHGRDDLATSNSACACCRRHV
jgi:hypothetical protein